MIKKIKINEKKRITTKEAVVIESLPGNIYKVRLKGGTKDITGYLAGNMIRNHIKLIKDDIVITEFSVFDKNRCRIVFRK
ncbi:MAG: translation initiation factor IF-1 [Candidatus Nasuia deltocephalinicola]